MDEVGYKKPIDVAIGAAGNPLLASIFWNLEGVEGVALKYVIFDFPALRGVHKTNTTDAKLGDSDSSWTLAAGLSKSGAIRLIRNLQYASPSFLQTIK